MCRAGSGERREALPEVAVLAPQHLPLLVPFDAFGHDCEPEAVAERDHGGRQRGGLRRRGCQRLDEVGAVLAGALQIGPGG